MNKTILLIGCSGGIGFKTAELLLKEGYLVTGTFHRQTDKLNELKERYQNFSSYLVDLKDLSSIQALKSTLSNQEIFAIINCAGIVKFETNSIEDDFSIWDETIAVNLSANFYLARTFFDNLPPGGRFIMISSTDSFYGGAITAAYAASKAGVNSLAKSLSLQLKDKKIRVNAIAPGWVSTPMIEGNSPEFYQQLAKANPLNKIAEPEDISNVIKFLLSPDSDYINGQVLTVDGGYTNQDPTLIIEEQTK